MIAADTTDSYTTKLRERLDGRMTFGRDLAAAAARVREVRAAAAN